MVIQRLKDAAEQAKIELSNVQETTINLPFLTADATGPKHLQKRLPRATLEQLIRPFVERSIEPVKKALSDAKKTVQQIDEVVLVGGSTRIPLVGEAVKKFFGKEPHRGVNPDEVVAIGAAVQGGVLSGDVKDVVLLDVTPLSLGVETLGGVMTVMIPRNTTIPTQKKEIFSTATDSQPSVEVHVLQGERTEARYNRTLGRFHLEGIMPAPRRRAEGRGDVRHRRRTASSRFTAKEHGDRQRSADHDHRGRRPQGGRDRQDGQRRGGVHEAEDKVRREEIERRNKLDNLCYTLERTLADNKDKIPEGDISTLTGIIAEARSAIEKQDDAAVATALEKLEKEAHRIASVMYEKSGPPAGGPPTDGDAPPPPPAGAGGKKDGVIDAEFEETN